MTGRGSKRKGSRIEREIVQRLNEAGIEAEKMPLSGALGGKLAGDLMMDNRYRGEVKARKTGGGFTTIARWMGANDVLFLREDRQDPLVVLRWDTFVELMNRDPL